MQAVLCTTFGPPEQLQLTEVAQLQPAADQVVIAVKACGVNFPDTLIIEGKYQFQPPMPFSPGSDVVGIVTAIGIDVHDVKVGDRVLAFCGYGGYADEVVVPANAILPLPESVEFIPAAAMLMPYATSYHALKDRAQLQPGETVLVLGAAGGVGLAAVQLAKAMGARVIAAASSAAKLAVCQQYGADATINYATEDLRTQLKSITKGKGVDVVYDPVGGAYTETALRSIAWGGRYLVVGFAAGDIPRIPLNIPLLKGCSIVGVFLGGLLQQNPAASQRNLHELVDWLAAGKITPHIAATYPLAEAAKALNAVLAHEFAGKIVMVPEVH